MSQPSIVALLPALDALQLRGLHADDRTGWEVLARAYKAFYETELPDAAYDRLWQRLLAGDAGVQALVLELDGELVGIAHYLFHHSAWDEAVCYLQDLFVTPTRRGLGLGKMLIEAVAGRARLQGAGRYYWLTHQDNATARRLYDGLAAHRGFIRYDYPLPTMAG